MSNEQIGSLIEKIQTHESRCQDNIRNKNLGYSISELSEKLDTVKKLKNIFQKRNDEKTANRLLLEELITEAEICFLRFSEAFVRSKFGRAWDEIHTSLNNYGFAIRVADQIGFESKENIAKFEKCKEIVEQFPQQWFMSTGILIKKVECSVCGKDIRECNHIKGRAYNGEHCCAIVRDMEIIDVSYTTNPLDPRCRAVPVGSDYEKGWFVGSGLSKGEIKKIMKKKKEIQNLILHTLGTFKDSL